MAKAELTASVIVIEFMNQRTPVDAGECDAVHKISFDLYRARIGCGH